MSSAPLSRRVVISGMGLIAPNGNDLGTFWDSLRSGRSAAAKVTKFNTDRLPTRIGAEVKDFEARRYMDAKMIRRSDLSTQYAIAASVLAVEDARVRLDRIDPDRVGVVEGTTVSSMESVLRGYKNYVDNDGYRMLSPWTVINGYCGEGSGRIALQLGIRGHAITYCTGCASGNDAIGYAAQMIRDDDADVIIAGATDELMIEPTYAGFCYLKLMSQRNDAPAGAMRPFDESRDGFVLGEGAAFLVLEELSHAVGRGARIYAEVAGHGRSCEAYHPTDSHPEGIGFRRAMEKALRQARIHPREVDYINAHGTATPSNDPIETLAIKRVFGEQAYRLAVSSTKPVTGHLMGASGAIEAVACALALRHQEMPPTINLERAAPGCDLDYVPGEARTYPLKVALNLSAGFGGKNSCLALRSYP